MVKGFVYFHEGKIPFVINEYRMELFSDNDDILINFTKEYNFKNHYILEGEHFIFGSQSQKINFLVEHSIGTTCYLCCYIIFNITEENGYDNIRIQSPFLDDVFRYKYNYLEIVRDGTNIATNPIDFYKIPFCLNDKHYELKYRIGQNNHIGLLENFEKKGEIIIPVNTNEIQECYDITKILYRLAMFMTSNSIVPFKQIILYKGEWKVGRFYSPLVSNEAASCYDIMFYKLDVMKYIPKILNNIALDCKNKITKSIPLGHIGTFDSLYSPQRFIEQVMAFEYLFDKLEHQKAKNRDFTLKKELEYMFNKFPDLLLNSKYSSKNISEQIKEVRRHITHGHEYYYDFKNDLTLCYFMNMLDKLIKNMSLLYIGFSKEEIKNFSIN